MSAGMICANCKKGVMYGHKVSHAKNKTKRLFKPNLHRAKIVIDGIGKTMRLCTKCLRMLKKNSKAPVNAPAQPAGGTAQQAV